MDKKEIMKWAAVAGGAYLVYWYITSYGPTGTKAEGHPSYWDTWFGGVLAPGSTQEQPATQLPPGTQVTTQPGLTQPSQQSQPVQPAQPSNVLAAIPDFTSLKQQIMAAIAASGNTIAGGYAIPDIWSYWYQQVTGRPITASQLSAAFPPGPNGVGAQSTLDQWLNAMATKGGLSGIVSVPSRMSGIVPVPSIPSIPSMSFGGSLRRPNLQGLRPMRVPGNTTVN